MAKNCHTNNSSSYAGFEPDPLGKGRNEVPEHEQYNIVLLNDFVHFIKDCFTCILSTRRTFL